MRGTRAIAAFGAGALLACGQLVGLEPPPTSHEPSDGPSYDADASATDATPLLDASDPSDGGPITPITDAADGDAASYADASYSDATYADASYPDATYADASLCALWSTVSSPAMSAIAAGPGGDVWTVGTSHWMAGSPDFANFELAGNAWTKQQGGGVQITISPDTGTAWLLNTYGQIFTFFSSAWHVVYSSPPMSVVAAGPSQAIWSIGTTPAADGSLDNAIYALVQGSWVQEAGGAIDITVAPDTGAPWIVDASGLVYRWDNGSWSPTNRGSVAMSSIAAGPGGILWAIGKTPSAKVAIDGSIYRSTDGASWQRQPGAAFRIAVSPVGVPWIVTANGVVSFGALTAPCP